MDPDNFQRAWQAQASQTRLTIDADLLLKEVRRNQQHFAATIFWRDVREVGTAVLMAPLWLYLGVKGSLPWTWYLMAPVLVWIAGYMLVDRRRHQQQPPEPDEPLRQRVQCSLAQVEHQIWLLRNVFWWYLLPLGIPMLALFVQVAWQLRAAGWLTALIFVGMIGVVAIAWAAVYRLNQDAVRLALEPRRQELEALLKGLEDETPAASG